jgi:hypothetical protein
MAPVNPCHLRKSENSKKLQINLEKIIEMCTMRISMRMLSEAGVMKKQSGDRFCPRTVNSCLCRSYPKVIVTNLLSALHITILGGIDHPWKEGIMPCRRLEQDNAG